MIELALLPFAIGLAANLYVSARQVLPFQQSILVGSITLGISLFFWYGLECFYRRVRLSRRQEREGVLERSERKEGRHARQTPLNEKIDHLLMEMRVALPGAQALLGFQFAIFLSEQFDRLPSPLKYLHLVSLCFISITTILLMTPAAYHRIVEEGEDTESFHRFSSRILLVSLITLALGITGDFFVVVRFVTHSTPFALTLSLLMLLFFYGLWFGWTIYRRNRREAHRKGKPAWVSSK